MPNSTLAISGATGPCYRALLALTLDWLLYNAAPDTFLVDVRLARVTVTTERRLAQHLRQAMRTLERQLLNENRRTPVEWPGGGDPPPSVRAEELT